MAQPKDDMTPAEAAKALVDAMHNLVQHAATIAHTKRAFYDAYIAEGFAPC